jgi:hypothetical protein
MLRQTKKPSIPVREGVTKNQRNHQHAKTTADSHHSNNLSPSITLHREKLSSNSAWFDMQTGIINDLKKKAN